VYLSATEIPESDHAVGGAACQGRVKALDGTNEVGVCVVSAAAGGLPRGVATGDRVHQGGGSLGGRPQDVEGLDAATLGKVPLTERLVGRAGDEGVAAEVKRGDFVDVGFENEEWAFFH
jgi:hypothetical protein